IAYGTHCQALSSPFLCISSANAPISWATSRLARGVRQPASCRPPLRLPHTRNPSLSRPRDRIKCSTLFHLECGGLPPLLQSQPNYARTTCDSPRGSAAPAAQHKLAQPVRAGNTTRQIGSAVGAPPNYARTTCDSPRGSAAPAAQHKLAQPVRAGNTTAQIGSA